MNNNLSTHDVAQDEPANNKLLVEKNHTSATDEESTRFSSQTSEDLTINLEPETKKIKTAEQNECSSPTEIKKTYRKRRSKNSKMFSKYRRKMKRRLLRMDSIESFNLPEDFEKRQIEKFDQVLLPESKAKTIISYSLHKMAIEDKAKNICNGLVPFSSQIPEDLKIKLERDSSSESDSNEANEIMSDETNECPKENIMPTHDVALNKSSNDQLFLEKNHSQAIGAGSIIFSSQIPEDLKIKLEQDSSPESESNEANEIIPVGTKECPKENIMLTHDVAGDKSSNSQLFAENNHSPTKGEDLKIKLERNSDSDSNEKINPSKRNECSSSSDLKKTNRKHRRSRNSKINSRNRRKLIHRLLHPESIESCNLPEDFEKNKIERYGTVLVPEFEAKTKMYLRKMTIEEQAENEAKNVMELMNFI